MSREKAPVSILKNASKPATLTTSTETLPAQCTSPTQVTYNMEAAHERRLSSTAREYNPTDFENSQEQLQKIGSNLTT